MDKRPSIILLFFLAACQSNGNSTKEHPESAGNSRTSITQLQIASGQISPYEEMPMEGASFQVVIRNNDTIFRSTRDSTFLTPENYRVGTIFGYLPQELKDNVKEEPGFSYYIDLA